MFNVIDSSHNTPGGAPADVYEGALRYVGFDNVASGDTSPLCRGGFANLITDFGFGPLGTGQPAPGTNLAGSTCRFFQPS